MDVYSQERGNLSLHQYLYDFFFHILGWCLVEGFPDFVNLPERIYNIFYYGILEWICVRLLVQKDVVEA